MSRKKFLTSVTLDEELVRRLDDESSRVRRSRSNVVEMILRNYFNMGDVEELEFKHANEK